MGGYRETQLVEQFRFKIKELERHLKNPTKQSLIECSAILRALIISDKQGLLGEIMRTAPGINVGKKKRLVRFRAAIQADSHIRDVPSGGYVHAIVQDDEISRMSDKEYTLDEFLKLPIVDVTFSDGEAMTITVKCAIKFVANKLGGVHFDFDSSDDKDQVLYNLDEDYQFRVAGSIVSHMRGLSNIVLATCKQVDDRLTKLGY